MGLGRGSRFEKDKHQKKNIKKTLYRSSNPKEEASPLPVEVLNSSISNVNHTGLAPRSLHFSKGVGGHHSGKIGRICRRHGVVLSSTPEPFENVMFADVDNGLLRLPVSIKYLGSGRPPNTLPDTPPTAAFAFDHIGAAPAQRNRGEYHLNLNQHMGINGCFPWKSTQIMIYYGGCSASLWVYWQNNLQETMRLTIQNMPSLHSKSFNEFLEWGDFLLKSKVIW